MKLRYNDPQATGQLGSEEQFNGNISEITWQNIQNVNQSTYGFVYDGLNRLSTAEYGETALYLEDNNFNESLSYDYNGNILSLQRTGAGAVIDNLTYDYMGNQLASVQDASTYNADLAHFKDGHTGTSPDYSYDANGNMKVDLNKGIADIQYNHLNLPEFIDFGNGNSITYYYDAAGIKLKKIVSENGTIKVTDYVGGLVYEDGQRQFLQTAEGRIMLNNETVNGPEYQYHLKDHLGNTRVTFTTAPEEDRTSTYLATMEPEVAALEEETFSIPDFRHTDALNNHTPGGATSIRTNGSEGKVTGPSMGLHVMPGDELNISAFFKYDNPATSGTTVAGVASLIAANVAGGATGELAEMADVVMNYPALVTNLTFSGDNSRPKAYIHYLYFDKDYNYQRGGMAQVGTTTGTFQNLSLQFTADQEGYVLVYTANQTAEDLNVFIDDLLIEHIESPVIRTDDYYPFGLAFNSSQRTGVLTNKYLFNGKELQEETGWLDYGARMYMPDIGRWGVIDNFADIYLNLSPYNYVANNPIILIDPDGNTIVDSQGNVVTVEFDDDGNITNITGTEDQSLIDLINNTYSDSDVGKETITTLNAEGTTYQINISEEGAIWESPDGEYGTVDGFSGPGSEFDVEINIFGNSTENTSDVNEENFDSFTVYDPYGRERKVNEKKKQKIIESVNSGEAQAQHRAEQESLGNLTPDQQAKYNAASQADKNNPSLRSTNTLIYETANSANRWGAKGETAAKIAVGKAHSQRKKQ